MIPTGRGLWLLAAGSVAFVAGFADPLWIAVGTVWDVAVLGLLVVDGRLAGRRRLELTRTAPSPMHQGERTRIELRFENPEPTHHPPWRSGRSCGRRVKWPLTREAAAC